jgi:hypothetical protein
MRELPAHGTATRYNRHKCRCETCRASHREYMRRYRNSALKGSESIPRPVYHRAVQRLVRLHPDELAQLIAEEQKAG